MNYSLKSFKRYKKEYGGRYLSYDFSSTIIERIYRMASSVDEGEEIFNEDTKIVMNFNFQKYIQVDDSR